MLTLPSILLLVLQGASPGASLEQEPAEKLVGNILRLNPAAWRTLKILTLDLSEQRGRVMRSTELIREALNDYFVKNGKPPVA